MDVFVAEGVGVVGQSPLALWDFGETLHDRPHRRIDEVEGHDRQCGKDEHPGSENSDRAGGQMLDQSVSDDEEAPDPADAERDGDPGLNDFAGQRPHVLERLGIAEKPETKPEQKTHSSGER